MSMRVHCEHNDRNLASKMSDRCFSIGLLANIGTYAFWGSICVSHSYNSEGSGAVLRAEKVLNKDMLN